VALPDDLQLHRRLPAGDPHHPGDHGGQHRDRDATPLNAGGDTLFGDLPGPGEGEGDGASGGRAEGPSRGFVIRTDGAARGNPGPASAGAALYDLTRSDARDHRATPDATISEYLGIQTNNVAEYTGVLRALELARDLGADEVHLLLDSKLIVEQLSGRWRVKDAKLIPLWAACRGILGRFARWSAGHVPRAQNSMADALANEAIDRVLAGGPPLVVRRPGED
jgi:ribonuclease HI